MAFEYTVDGKTLMGSIWMAYGTFTNGGGDTGGDIDTELPHILTFIIQEGGGTVVTNRSVVNATFPLLSRIVPIVTDADVDGYWIAYGYLK